MTEGLERVTFGNKQTALANKCSEQRWAQDCELMVAVMPKQRVCWEVHQCAQWQV